MDENERKAKTVQDAADKAAAVKVAEYRPKPGIIAVFARGAYTTIAWIDSEGGIQETRGEYIPKTRTFKANGGPVCPFITNEDRS